MECRDGTSPAELFRCGCRGAAFRPGGSTGAYRPAGFELSDPVAGKGTRRSPAGALDEKGRTDQGRGDLLRSLWILGDVDLSAEVVRSVAGKARRKIRIGTVYPATIGLLPAFLARIGRKYPDIELHISSGSTNDIIRGLENGQISASSARSKTSVRSGSSRSRMSATCWRWRKTARCLLEARSASRT